MKTYLVSWTTRKGTSERRHRHEFQAANARAARMLFMAWRENRGLKAEPLDITVEVAEAQR